MADETLLINPHASVPRDFADGLLDMRNTKQRVSRMWAEAWWGLDPKSGPNIKTFPNENEVKLMLVQKDIPFTSWCSHHLLPFSGVAHIAYIPDKLVIGLSKIPRIVEWKAAQPQVQELLTEQIAQTMQDALKPVGIAVVLEATHGCVMHRGVRSHDTATITSKMLGAFLHGHNEKSAEGCRNEFFSLIGRKQ